MKSKLGFLAIFLVFVACHGNRHATSSQNEADQLLQKKYAELLGVPSSEIANLKLYRFVDEWYSVPYQYGGKTKTGVDCSGFTSALYRDVYSKPIAGSAASLYKLCDDLNEKNLNEGDLVFFKINSEKISHVGVYLRNRRFVHASTHKGVVISSLDEAYYKKYFFKGGKVK
jgi:murein DD-endopeptidase / murein LD-carboxypeptidase